MFRVEYLDVVLAVILVVGILSVLIVTNKKIDKGNKYTIDYSGGKVGLK